MIVHVRKQNPPLEPLTTAQQLQQPSTCRLLQLPCEIRNLIYENLLIQQSRQRQDDVQPARFVCHANILRTSKQIHLEATPILYGENTFLAHPSLLASLPSFLIGAKPYRGKRPPVKHLRVASMIRKFYLVVRLDIDPQFTANMATESFNGVEKLEIEVFQAMYGSSDFSVLKLFEDIRGVREAVVRGSVGDGNYARYLETCLMAAPGTVMEKYEEKYVGGIRSWDAWAHRHGSRGMSMTEDTSVA